VADAQRAALLESRLLLVRGKLQREGDVLHVDRAALDRSLGVARRPDGRFAELPKAQCESRRRSVLQTRTLILAITNRARPELDPSICR